MSDKALPCVCGHPKANHTTQRDSAPPRDNDREPSNSVHSGGERQ